MDVTFERMAIVPAFRYESRKAKTRNFGPAKFILSLTFGLVTRTHPTNLRVSWRSKARNTTNQQVNIAKALPQVFFISKMSGFEFADNM